MTDTPTSYTGRPAGTPGTSDSVTRPSSDDPSTGDDKMEVAKGVARDVEQSGRRAVGNVADGELPPPPAAISDPALPIHTDVTASNSAGRP